VCTESAADAAPLADGADCTADTDGCASTLSCGLNLVKVLDGVTTASLCIPTATCGTDATVTASADSAAYTVTTSTICVPNAIDPPEAPDIAQDESCLSNLAGCAAGL